MERSRPSDPLAPFPPDLRGRVRGDRWQPAVDVFESEKAIVVRVELAGVTSGDVRVSLDGEWLVIQGERRLGACEEGVVYHAAGIRQGPFRLELPLPAAVDPAGVEARYERGLLRIALRKAR